MFILRTSLVDFTSETVCSWAFLFGSVLTANSNSCYSLTICWLECVICKLHKFPPAIICWFHSIMVRAHILYDFLKIQNYYFKIWETGWEVLYRIREWVSTFVHWFTTQMPTVTGVGQDKARNEDLIQVTNVGGRHSGPLSCHLLPPMVYISRKLELGVEPVY